MALLLTPEVAAPASSPAAPPPVPPPVCAVALLLSRLEKKPEPHFGRSIFFDEACLPSSFAAGERRLRGSGWPLVVRINGGPRASAPPSPSPLPLGRAFRCPPSW